MKNRKKVNLPGVQDRERIEFIWKIRRQVQQEILEKKLMQCFLKGRDGHECAPQYPEAMDPLIKDFMRKAEQETKRMGLYCV
jgi:hypothetical protein